MEKSTFFSADLFDFMRFASDLATQEWPRFTQIRRSGQALGKVR